MRPIKNAKHLNRVRELPCRVCPSREVQAHHIRDTGITGIGQKASDWLTFSLCQPCHACLHSEIKAWERAHGTQIWHVTETLEILYG